MIKSSEKIKELTRLKDKAANLEEPLTWRKLIIEIKKLFDIKSPEFDPLPQKSFTEAKNVVKVITADSPLERLQTEILYALGFNGLSSDRELDALIINAVHNIEPIFLTLYKSMREKGKVVAAFDAVGHYNDMQTRIVGPARLFGKVKRLIFVASTQEMYDGDIAVLANSLRLLRNKEFTTKIERVEVVIPMFGGSRGHRKGQSAEVGYEVLEAIFNAKLLALTTKDIFRQLTANGMSGKAPKVTFYSIDIHNNQYPRKTFKDSDFKFISVSPSDELANSFCRLLKKESLENKPIKVVACDKGAVERTRNLAVSILKTSSIKVNELEVIYFEKYRPRAGEVKQVKISKLEKWRKKGKSIQKADQPIIKITEPSKEDAVLLYSDDMIDTGGTATKDMHLLLKYYPKAVLKVFAATHPILSKGLLALERIGADFYLLGNTLQPEGLSEVDNVITVDLAPSIINNF